MTQPDHSSDPDSESDRSQWMAFLTMGISSAVIVALGVVLGVFLDRALHSAPLFLFLGILLGCIAAVLAVIAQVKRSL